MKADLLRLLCIVLVLSVTASFGCMQSEARDKLLEAYAPGKSFDLVRPARDRIIFDSGMYEYSPVRVAVVGYSEPKNYLKPGERLVVVLEGELAIYVFVDTAGEIIRREVVGS